MEAERQEQLEDSSSLPATMTGRSSEDLLSRDPDRPPSTDGATQLDPGAHYISDADLSELPSLAFESHIANFFGLSREPVPDDHELVVMIASNGDVHQVIERANNVLNRAEALQHAEECRIAMRDELLRWEHLEEHMIILYVVVARTAIWP